MQEQKYFPAYQPESPAHKNDRISLMLTYQQSLLIASSLRLLDEMLSIKNPIKKITFNPHLSEVEFNQLEAIHNACINCALSYEALLRTKGAQNEE